MKQIMEKIDKEESIEETVEIGTEVGIMTEIEAETETEIGIEEEVIAKIKAEIGIIAEVIAEEGIIRGIKVEVEIKARTQTVESTRKHTRESTKQNILTIRIIDTTKIENSKTEAKVEIDQVAEIEQDLRLQMERDTEGKVQEELYSTEVEVRAMKER